MHEADSWEWSKFESWFWHIIINDYEIYYCFAVTSRVAIGEGEWSLFVVVVDSAALAKIVHQYRASTQPVAAGMLLNPWIVHLGHIQLALRGMISFMYYGAHCCKQDKSSSSSSAIVSRPFQVSEASAPAARTRSPDPTLGSVAKSAGVLRFCKGRPASSIILCT